MADQITSFDLGPAWRRVLLVVPMVVAAAAGVWFAARWCVGHELALWAPEVEGMSRASLVATAARLAPDDPQTHFTLARLGDRSFLPGELPAAVARYERAAALSPNDYRLWVDLGRARSAAGDADGAERALRRATELAPNYPGPRWYLGNLLLREGRTEEAFDQLRRAGDANPEVFRPQIFNMAWGAFGGDIRRLGELAGDSVESRSALAEYLIGRERLDDALAVWRGFEGAELTEDQIKVGIRLRDTLAKAKRFHDALAVERVLRPASGPGPLPEIERVTNGGFEDTVGPPGQHLFEWQVVPAGGAQMNLDAGVPRGGARSLRILFESSGKLEFNNVSQLVAVRPSARYRLEYYFRTEGLKSAVSLRTVVSDAAAEPAQTLGASEPLPMGATEGWRPVTIEFTTGPRTEAVLIAVMREQCDEAVCPIFGRVWYDNFNLQRIGGAAGPRAGQRADSGGDR
ncbi:MAG TPA: tetratricopeptide repeat protein [Pyrinomonadaceae bacterium]|nr:tetratricopeptide repeat protein [Pyrinomonadaceae bacterium]